MLKLLNKGYLPFAHKAQYPVVMGRQGVPQKGHLDDTEHVGGKAL